MKILKTKIGISGRECEAFTLTDLLAVVAVIAVLFCLHVSAHTGLKDQTRIAQCSGNLKQLDLAFQIYGEENHDQVPSVPPEGYWAWNLPSAAGAILTQWVQQKQLYCPGTSDRFSEQDNSNLWNYGGTSFHVIGYAMTLPTTPAVAGTLFPTNVNATLTPQRVSIGPVIIPLRPSQRVLVADATLSTAAGYSYSLRYTYNYTDVVGGYSLHHLSPHLNGVFPAGGNVGMLDGHVEWRKFDDMQCRTLPSSGVPAFWW